MVLTLFLLPGFTGTSAGETQLPAGVSVVDDSGQQVLLPRAARRIISLSPHITELLFAAGAGSRVVGVVRHSDYPEAAAKLPSVGEAGRINHEILLSLKPDLVVAWQSGNRRSDVIRIRQQEIPVYLSEPVKPRQISQTLRNLGQLAGTSVEADLAARQFDYRLDNLRKKYSGLSPVRTFFQLWQQPMMTVTEGHMIGQILKICGAKNPFANLAGYTPVLSWEAVLAERPEVVILSGPVNQVQQWKDKWKHWPQVPAVANNQIYSVHADLLHRQTPRILDGMTKVCELVDRARRAVR